MASWLKVAEDLLEVVDRRAKLVVGELSDEQRDSQSPPGVASNGKEVQSKKKKSKDHSIPITEPSKASDTEREQTKTRALASNVARDKNVDPPSENAEVLPSDSEAEAALSSDIDKDTALSGLSSSETLPRDLGEHEADSVMEASATENDAEAPVCSINGDVSIENTKEDPEKPLSSQSSGLGVDLVNGNDPVPADFDPKVKLADEDVPSTIEQESSEPKVVETHKHGDAKEKDAEPLQEPLPNLKNPEEQQNDASPMRVQDQLDEAQGLLKTAISTGQSKEARLAKVCAGLSSRLQEYKSENAQLEELLVAERERSNSFETRIKQLQQDLSLSKTAAAKVESDMADAFAAKNSEIEALVSTVDALKKQAAVSEGKLVTLQANMESLMRNRELTETRMMQALREELSAAERRAEEEHTVHNATKMAAMERQVELEHRAIEASTALAKIQRTLDERTLRAAELEQKLALLELECASLNQELQDMEARARREQKRFPEEANQVLQMQAWQEEVERARLGQRDAESKLSSMEAELQKMRVEMAGMKRDAEHYSRQEHMELEKRYRELTDLLYHKQTQLEAMASEKAAAEFQLEKETKRLQEAQVEAERNRVSRRASSSWEEETDLKTLESLPLHHRHVAGARKQLQRAAKLLDSGTVSATRFLWRYPIARVILLFYLVFVHLFLMYLLHHLQEQADKFASKDMAASMQLP